MEGAHETGRLAVELVERDLRPSGIVTRGSFLNAIVALAAIGGSTNAVVHLLALAGRLGVELTLDDFDRIGAGVPLLVDLQPAGRHLMEDLHRAGGLLAETGCTWANVVHVAFFLHRNENPKALLDGVAATATVPLGNCEVEQVDGYSRPGKLIEIEITAKR